MYEPGRVSTRSGLGLGLWPLMGNMLMLSTPPASITSACPVWMAAAAIAMVWRPLEQKRLTVTPPTLSGIPARRAARRATFRPCSASGMAQPR